MMKKRPQLLQNHKLETFVLLRFYSSNSSFVHGGLDSINESGRDGSGGGKVNTDPVHGQHEIHQRIMQLNFRDCKAKIRQVDAHATLGSGVVVQVSVILFIREINPRLI